METGGERRPKLVGSEAWDTMMQIRDLKALFDRQMSVAWSGPRLPEVPECQSAGDIIWDVKEALFQMADVLYEIRTTLEQAGQGCCPVPLDFAAASGGEELNAIVGGRCSGLLGKGEEFKDLDVCRSLEVLRAWLLTCANALS